MRLLVTRPEPDAARTAARLAALGHSPLVQPLLEITLNAPPETVPEPAALLLTSQNGVRAIARWPQKQNWLELPAYAAGTATARALADLGFRDVRTGAGDAGSLADIVFASMPASAGTLLYPAARDRAGALAGGLLGRGYDIRTIEAYRANAVTQFLPAVREELAAGRVGGVLVYSGRTARALLTIAAREGLTDAVARARHFVISPHVAAILSEIGAPVSVADRPDEDSLFARIPAVT